MNDDLKYIDEFYKNNLSNHSEQASGKVWKKLLWSLFWLRYKWLLMVSAALLIMSIGGFWIWSSTGRSPVTLPSPKQSVGLTTEPAVNNPEKIELFSNAGDQTLLYENLSKNETPSKKHGVEQPLPVQNIKSENQHQTANTVTGRVAELNPLANIDLLMILSSSPDTVRFGEDRLTTKLVAPSQNHFMVTVFGGLSYNKPFISGFNNEYALYREKNEHEIPGWSAGVNLSYRIKRFTFGMGLNYSRYSRYRDYKYTYSVYDPEKSYYDYDTTFIWIYDPPYLGKPIVKSIDSSWIEVYSDVTNDYSGHNYIDYFEIPLYAGYRLNTGRLGIEPGIGISIGFLTVSNYKIPLTTNDCVEPVQVTDMNRVMVSYFASVMLNYQLDHRFSVYLQPVYKHNLRSVFGSDFPVTEQYKTFGVNLGIGFVF